MATTLNPFAYMFDVIGILQSGGMQSVNQIEEKMQQLRGEPGVRRRDSIYRLLEAGHNCGYFYKHEKCRIGGSRSTTFWGYSQQPFSEPDVTRETPVGKSWSGSLVQRVAAMRYDEILTYQEKNPEKGVGEIAKDLGIGTSAVSRAGAFFEISYPGPRSSLYFRVRGRKAPLLTEKSRQDIITRLRSGENESTIREEYSLTRMELDAVKLLRQALDTPAEKLKEGLEKSKIVREKLSRNHRWLKEVPEETPARLGHRITPTREIKIDEGTLLGPNGVFHLGEIRRAELQAA